MEYYQDFYCCSTMDEVRLDFKRNGVTKDLDDMDHLIINCRRQQRFGTSQGNVAAGPKCDLTFQRSLEKARKILSHLKPLANKKNFCVFCKNNKEHFRVFSTHTVKNEQGEVTCPILSKYVCPRCGSTGKKAHTIKYCPFNDGTSSVDSLFRTPRNGAGKPRWKEQTEEGVNRLMD